MPDKKGPSEIPESLIEAIYSRGARVIASEGLLEDIREKLLARADQSGTAPEEPEAMKIFSIVKELLTKSGVLKGQIEAAVEEMHEELETPEAQGLLYRNLANNSRVFDLVIKDIRGQINGVMPELFRENEERSNIIPFPKS